MKVISTRQIATNRSKPKLFAVTVTVMLSLAAGAGFINQAFAASGREGVPITSIDPANSLGSNGTGIDPTALSVTPANHNRIDPETTNGTPVPIIQSAVLDFDGDNKTDEVVTRGPVGGTSTWYILGSTAGFSAVFWGIYGLDFYVPADYDDDDKWDIAVYRPNPGTFFILQSATNTLRIERFGSPGDYPMATQDFDGDGEADPTVTRLVGGQLNWYILRSALGFTGFTFGNADDLPVRGDFDGDHKADVAVYRNNTGSPANTFFVLPSGGGPLRSQTFGTFGNDSITPGDFDGDGKTDYAVFRAGMIANSGTWFWLRSSDGVLAAAVFGDGQVDIPTPGDYDGDGTTDPSVWRRTGVPTFHHLCSTTGYFATVFGLGPDDPVSFYLQVRN